MRRRIFFLNGPPRSGKDSVADFLVKEFGFSKHKFAQPFKNVLELKLTMSGHKGTLEELRKHKEIELGLSDYNKPLTLRKWQIELSEKIVKQGIFKDSKSPFFGVACAFCVAADPNPNTVISDCGFESEALGFLELLRRIEDEPPLISLIRLHRTGKCFQGDSRNWVVLPGIDTISLFNPEDESRGLEALYASVRTIVQ